MNKKYSTLEDIDKDFEYNLIYPKDISESTLNNILKHIEDNDIKLIVNR